MIIKCMSRKDCEKYLDKINISTIIISIKSTGDSTPFKLTICNNPNVIRIRYFEFDDVLTDYDFPYNYAITKKDSERIAKFVINYKDKIEQIIVHCDMGISRSAGVAAAIAKYLNLNNDRFFKEPYHPNKTCYDMVLSSLNKLKE